MKKLSHLKSVAKRVAKSFAKKLRPEGHEGIRQPEKGHATFALVFGVLPVGELAFDDGWWQFSYSTQFKRQTRIEPLREFPDVEKIYRAQQLWPFFAFRVPSLTQPEVEKTIESKHIDRHNIIELLREFGRRSIANPFELKPGDSEPAGRTVSGQLG